MTDNEIINIGDVCTYSYFEKNRSISIVEVVKELSEETVVIKFHQVIFDNSGNDFFIYLCNTGQTMNASKKYLRKIDLINRQNETIDGLISAQETLQKHIEKQNAEIERLEQENHHFADIGKMYSEVKAEVIKEFAERLKEEADGYDFCGDGVIYQMVDIDDIDNLVEEMVGEDNAT